MKNHFLVLRFLKLALRNGLTPQMEMDRSMSLRRMLAADLKRWARASAVGGARCRLRPESRFLFWVGPVQTSLPSLQSRRMCSDSVKAGLFNAHRFHNVLLLLSADSFRGQLRLPCIACNGGGTGELPNRDSARAEFTEGMARRQSRPWVLTARVDHCWELHTV